MADSVREHLQAVELRRRRRERVAIVVVALAIVAMTLVEVRVSRFAGQGPVANHLLFFSLININVILTLLLGFLVFRNLAKLLFDRRRERMGVKLRTKLVIAFVAFTLAPSILLFSVSTGFVVNSIDKWFGPRAEQSLDEALKVATAYYQRAEDDAKRYASQIATDIGSSESDLLSDPDALDALVNAKREEYDLAMIEVFGEGRAELARVSDPDVAVASFSSADADFIEQGLAGKTAGRVQTVEVSEGSADVIRGIAPIRGEGAPVGVVVVNYYVPVSLTAKMGEIYRGVHEFRQLQDYLSPVRSSYVIVLATITLLVIFSATWLGFYMSREITQPLQHLADATRAVAAGDFAVRIPGSGNDEIGVVVQGFNQMTGHLRTSRKEIEAANQSLRAAGEESERRRQYLETVLENVAAGVLALDSDGKVMAVNEAAAQLLEIDAASAAGRGYRDLLPDDVVGIAWEMFREADATHSAVTRELNNVTLAGQSRTLLVTVSAMRDSEGHRIGLVAVLDDLTELVKAQRVAAWREVARRIAHEIKNPLTPIQLSAQRLRRRFGEQLDDGSEVFDECTSTIIRQVEELKALVGEFSEFARLPEAQPAPNDLNDTVGEAVALYRDAHAGVEVAFEPDRSLPVFDLDREQIKRVVINLLDNAVAAVLEGGGGTIQVHTVFEESLRIARMEVADDGPGISPEAMDRLFEPYFSTKKEGTGLGLAIVRRIVIDHDGFIRVQRNEPTGTRFIVELPVKRAPSRSGRDQSGERDSAEESAA